MRVLTKRDSIKQGVDDVSWVIRFRTKNQGRPLIFKNEVKNVNFVKQVNNYQLCAE